MAEALEIVVPPEGWLVKLTYFKPGGKYYTDVEYRSHCVNLFEVNREVDELRRSVDPRTGMHGGGQEYVTLVEVPGHPHEHPHMLPPLREWSEESPVMVIGTRAMLIRAADALGLGKLTCHLRTMKDLCAGEAAYRLMCCALQVFKDAGSDEARPYAVSTLVDEIDALESGAIPDVPKGGGPGGTAQTRREVSPEGIG